MFVRRGGWRARRLDALDGSEVAKARAADCNEVAGEKRSCRRSKPPPINYPVTKPPFAASATTARGQRSRIVDADGTPWRLGAG